MSLNEVVSSNIILKWNFRKVIKLASTLEELF
jgi:hypothetical protein